MPTISSLSSHLSPDCVARLERAAQNRFGEANFLREGNHRLAALYLYGYCVEMCLAAAYFRSLGFSENMIIDRDLRNRRMAQARQLKAPSGEPFMSGDPHPLVGWARLLQWQRMSSGAASVKELRLLKEAVNKAERIYRHWRPELRYKIVDVTLGQIDEVSRAANWFVKNRGQP